MKNIYLAISIQFIISCSNAEKDSVLNHNDLVVNSQHLKAVDHQQTFKTEIIDYDFANAPLGDFNFNNKDLSTYFNGEYDIIKTTARNKFTENVDTLISFKRAESSVRFYKTNSKTFLDSLNISDSNFVSLRNNFDIGMSKKDFLNYFKVEEDGYLDSISVTNEENSFVSFLFTKGRLDRILIVPY